MKKKIILVLSPAIIHLNEQSVRQLPKLLLHLHEGSLETFNSKIRVLRDVLHVIIAPHTKAMRFDQHELVEEPMVSVGIRPGDVPANKQHDNSSQFLSCSKQMKVHLPELRETMR